MTLKIVTLFLLLLLLDVVSEVSAQTGGSSENVGEIDLGVGIATVSSAEGGWTSPALSTSGPSELLNSSPTCWLLRQAQLVNCRGVNTTQLVAALARIFHQENQASDSDGRTNELPDPTTGDVSDGNTTDITETLTDDDPNTTSSSNNSTDFDSSAEPKGISSTPPRVRELVILRCEVAKLTAEAVNTSSNLAVLSVVSSGLTEVLRGSLTAHAISLTRLTLTHNLLTAIPAAIANLTVLEELDLRHNLINHLPEASLFFNLHRLRHLHLDHNNLGQVVDAQVRLGLTSPGLSMKIFNVEPLRESLTELSLAHNNLSSFPQQFSRSFPRLAYLDLSSNLIKEVLDDSFQLMPVLQELELSGNLLQKLPPTTLPPTLLYLGLRGNPWECTCETLWLFNSVLANSSSASGSLTSPTCSSPLHLYQRDLTSLTEEDLCPHVEEDDSSTEVVYVGDNIAGPLKEVLSALHILNVTSLNHQALIVAWRVEALFYSLAETSTEPLSWAITLRATRENPRNARLTKMTLRRYQEERPSWKPSESLFTEVLHGLEAETDYTLCLTPVQNHRLFTRPDHCLNAATLPELYFTTSSTAPSTTTTTTTTKTPKTLTHDIIKDYAVETERVLVVQESRRVTLSWNVTVNPVSDFGSHVDDEMILLRPLGWKITYRRFAEENETEVVLVSRGGEPIQNFTNHYTVEELQPGTGYTFCFHSMSELEVAESLTKNSDRVSDGEAQQHSHVAHYPDIPSFPANRGRSVHAHSDNQNTVVSDNESKTTSSLPSAPTIHTQVPTPSFDINQDKKATDEHPLEIETDDFSSHFPSLPNFHPQGANNPHSSNIPPVPSFPSSQSFSHRPPRPTEPPSGGNFVYTSTGERIPLPSTSAFASPFNLPSVVGPRIDLESRGPQSIPSQFSSILDVPRSPGQSFPFDFNDRPTREPSKQLFTYDFANDESAATELPDRQQFTYAARKRRSTDESNTTYKKKLESGTIQYCQEVVTEEEDQIAAPIAIATTVSSSTTAVIAIICCCCCPKKCRRKKSDGKGESGSNSRKVSTISVPSPVNVYSRNSSLIAGTVIGNGDLKNAAVNGKILSAEPALELGSNGSLLNTNRSVSGVSSSGYLTPLPTANGVVAQDASQGHSEAKMILQSPRDSMSPATQRMLRPHEDLKDFHPGYDIPPTSSIKSLLGYDYPHPTPVNPIGSHSRQQSSSEPQNTNEGPSSPRSDFSFNSSIADNRDPNSLQSEVNLNIPFAQRKSSDIRKSIDLNESSESSDLNKSMDYNYAEDGGNKPRTYVKNGHFKSRHRKFGSPHRLPEEHHIQSHDGSQSARDPAPASPVVIPTHLSRSTPDLAIASRDAEDTKHLSPNLAASARLNLLIGNEMGHSHPRLSNDALNGSCSLPMIQPALPPKCTGVNNGYVNHAFSSDSIDSPREAGRPREVYHTWSSSRPSTPRSRPSLGEVVLTGGTLIEVPEGYVVPKPPKPARSVKLAVPATEKSTKGKIPEHDSLTDNFLADEESLKYGQSLPPLTIPISGNERTSRKSKITQLMTPEMDENRIVISTGMPLH